LAGSRIQSKFFLTASATPSAGAASALQSAAGIDWLEIKSVSDAFGGDAFGPSGPYVYIAAVAHGKLDPRDPANSRIVDLDKAPRTNGLVDYQVDVGILRPKDAAVAGTSVRPGSICQHDVERSGAALGKAKPMRWLRTDRAGKTAVAVKRDGLRRSGPGGCPGQEWIEA